jgi:hypothetical protein
MGETKTYLALFSEIDPAARAVDRLKEQGIGDDQISIISGVPIATHLLGRPKVKSYVPWFSLGGAALGILLGIFLSAGITNLYPLKVGRQGLVNGGPTVVILFEMMVLFMLVFTFIGVFLNSDFPSYRPKEYTPAISDGKIGVLYEIPEEKGAEMVDTLTSLGAESVAITERQKI